MTKVNHVDDLPEWFCLENYEAAENFSAAEWVEQLERRADILTLHPEFSEEYFCEDAEFSLMIWPALIEREAEQIRQQPLFSHGKENLEKHALNPDERPVKPVRLFDIGMQKDRDCIALRDGKASQSAVDRWELLSSERTMKIAKILSHASKPFVFSSYNDDGNASPVISIDLGATDAVLIASFEAWLKEVRAQQPEISKRNRPAYKDWARYGLLPYLDLLIWSKENGRHIPRRIFSAAVSRYDKGESAFSKTVVPLAAGLMKDLSELKALAAYEALEQQK